MQWYKPDHPIRVIEGVITQGEVHLSPRIKNTPRKINSRVCPFAMEILERIAGREEGGNRGEAAQTRFRRRATRRASLRPLTLSLR
jgi:hypothetical protein